MRTSPRSGPHPSIRFTRVRRGTGRRWLAMQLQQAEIAGPLDGLVPRVRPELPVDRSRVRVDRVVGQVERLCGFSLGQALLEELEDLELPLGEGAVAADASIGGGERSGEVLQEHAEGPGTGNWV